MAPRPPERLRTTWFRGCRPELAAGPDGRIIAVGEGASEAAGRGARVVELRGRALPGLGDAHVHLEWLGLARLGVRLDGTASPEEVLARVRAAAARLPAGAWVVGRGWDHDRWRDPRLPGRRALDEAGGGRPVLLTRKDGHSAWLSTAALRAAGLAPGAPDPPGGVVDREPGGEPSGIVRERAVTAAQSAIPPPSDELRDRGLELALGDLLARGLTHVHTMDTATGFAALQRLHARGRLPLRVTYNLPLADLAAVERLGIRSGWGDDRLRVWGVKAFLDGSLGSRTAEMLDGSGVAVLPQPELADLVRRAAAAELNVCLHAIGDRAVRRALDALEPHTRAWRHWRPRIEHVQACHPDDQPRFARAGVIASMQPLHAVADRELADAHWGGSTAWSYAWGALHRAGARLAFGSDAPVEPADPLAGIEAATTWRRRAGWYPELSVSPAVALRASTWGVAFAVGMERDLGRLAPGRLADLTVVEGDRVTATVVGGRVAFSRR